MHRRPHQGHSAPHVAGELREYEEDEEEDEEDEEEDEEDEVEEGEKEEGKALSECMKSRLNAKPTHKKRVIYKEQRQEAKKRRFKDT